jgi:hypothetical protein
LSRVDGDGESRNGIRLEYRADADIENGCAMAAGEMKVENVSVNPLSYCTGLYD